MRTLWESLLACLPPAWRVSPDPARRETLLKFIIVVAIFMFAGSELIAALELQIFLEMLGATLFLTAFIAGARLAVWSLGDSLRRFALPLAPVALIFVAYIDLWMTTAVASIASVHALW
jgi:hypothetical protein